MLMKAEYLSLSDLSGRSSLSLATLKRAITRPDQRLPSYLVGRRRLVKWADFERWLEGQQRPTASAAAQSVLGRLAA
jgi:hypothetical protein